MTAEKTGRFAADLAAVRKLAAETAAPNAAEVDAGSRFPHESLAALREAKLLSAPIPQELGGAGYGVRELGELCAALARACGSSAMVLAMHYAQLACIIRHASQAPFFRRYLEELAGRQYLLASMTSENGTFGETRTSICAVERKDGRFKLDKDATTGSYCEYADAILVTCRRDAAAPGSDQVLVLVRKGDYQLRQTTSWNAMGMRGTCSPGFKLESAGPEEQVLPGAFADIAAQTMVPYSHILWSSLWWGIAADAVARAAEFVRGAARRNPGSVPPTAVRLAEVSAQLQAMRHNWQALAEEFDALEVRGPAGAQELLSIGWALKMNALKIAASEAAPQIVHQALKITGLLGYKNDSPFSLGRHYRDVLSAALMISNDRIASKNASMLLIFKDA
ncbi:MAG TPA: acyl-CoA dehydrogenase family protein [Steroidobacteraceae bacterium]|nr:acyl-CoA dehydrogenase family protein [Steroidobacteraceae bacterium]